MSQHLDEILERQSGKARKVSPPKVLASVSNPEPNVRNRRPKQYQYGSDEEMKFYFKRLDERARAYHERLVQIGPLKTFNDREAAHPECPT
jgi:hypothetical protein